MPAAPFPPVLPRRPRRRRRQRATPEGIAWSPARRPAQPPRPVATDRARRLPRHGVNRLSSAEKAQPPTPATSRLTSPEESRLRYGSAKYSVPLIAAAFDTGGAPSFLAVEAQSSHAGTQRFEEHTRHQPPPQMPITGRQQWHAALDTATEEWRSSLRSLIREMKVRKEKGARQNGNTAP